MTSKPAVGHVDAELQLKIGDCDPILLTGLALPITIRNGSDYVTYDLGIDLKSITDTVRAIFKAAES